MLQNDFCKQSYITFNATIPGQDRIYPNTNLCRTFLLGICSQVGFLKCVSFVQIEQEDVGDETRVKVRIPENGQYALKIFTREEGEREYKETCNYLLRQQNRVRVQEVRIMEKCM